MTGPATAFLLLGVVLAIGDWWAVAASRRGVERVLKPATIVALIGATLTLEPTVDGTVRTLVVIALVASLVGDLLLLPGGSLPGGLIAFAGAQVAYATSFALRDPAPEAIVAGIAVAAVIALALGRRIVGGAPARLRPGVIVYLALILVMACLATGTLVPAAVAGAWLFVASDARLGWSLFVSSGDAAPARRAVTMATYHIAQLLLVLALLG